MGSGGSFDAEYSLQASVPAGAYHVLCDAIIIVPVDVQFELIHRTSTGDRQLATWTQHFEPLPGAFRAQPYELDVQAPAIDFSSGDQFVFRYTGLGSTANMAFIPNGEGDRAMGRFPNITLPAK